MSTGELIKNFEQNSPEIYGREKRQLTLTTIADDHPTQRSGHAYPIPLLKRIFSFSGIAFNSVITFPILLAALYFGSIASDIYVSEAKFLIRTSNTPDTLSLVSLSKSGTLSRAMDETFAVNEYLTSYDVLKKIVRHNSFKEILARKEVDFLSRYPNFLTTDTDEHLRAALRRHVTLQLDETSGISTLVVKAYRSEDAFTLAQSLLSYAEIFINGLNERAHQDALQYFQKLVDQNAARVDSIERSLSAYRNSNMLLDPEKEATAANATLSRLTLEISRLEAEVAQQSKLSPLNPSLSASRERIKALRNVLQSQQREIAGNSTSIASKIQGYENLILQRELAITSLTAAVSGLEKARQETQLQKLYLVRIADANVPDQPILPYRMLSILLVAALALAIYGILRAFLKATLEHK